MADNIDYWDKGGAVAITDYIPSVQGFVIL
jgi:hypothetical protein